MKHQRVYQMTRLAMFEEEHRGQLEDITRLFRGDYIGRHMIKTGLLVTAAYILILAGWGLMNIEMLVVDITEIDIVALVTRILFLYAFFLCVFLVLTYSIQCIRYARAEKDLEQYQHMLKELEKSYLQEEAEKKGQVIRKGQA